MTRARWAISVLFAASLAVAPGIAQTERETVFPFARGTTWTYAGTVRWTNENNRPQSRAVRWRSTVVDAFDAGDVAGELLQGGVWDLAWWSPGARPGTYAILRAGQRYYLLRDDEARAAYEAVKASGRAALSAKVERSAWFDAPLQAGALVRPGDVPPRSDARYGWLVEKAAPVDVAIPGIAANRHVPYRLSFTTLPDEEHDTFVPGIGVTAFAYLHHGTVSAADVRLVSFRQPEREDVVPLVRGTSWTYAGTVRWMDGRNRQRRSEVRFTSTVVDAFDDGRVAGALLHGGVWDTFGYGDSPLLPPQDYAVLRVASRYYLFRLDRPVPVRTVFAAAKASHGRVLPAELFEYVWFDAPLTVGRWLRPSDIGPGSSTGWRIERAVAVTPVPAMPSTARRGYVVNYLTIASDDRVTIVPGIGIVAHDYSHHGTLAEAHVRLVRMQPGRGL